MPPTAGQALRHRMPLAGVLLFMSGTVVSPPAGQPPANQAPVWRDLPQPAREGPLSLEQVLHRRRSVRAFAPAPLSEHQVAQLLWATQGVTDPRGYRTAPSAGALFPLEVYVVTPVEVLLYDPAAHRVRPVARGDVRAALQSAALSQEPVGAAPAVFAIAGVYGRTAAKYGDTRARRYVHLEAGHAAQNLLLQAVALGLAAVPVGAFHDSMVARVLRLPPGHEPLYLIPVGKALE